MSYKRTRPVWVVGSGNYPQYKKKKIGQKKYMVTGAAKSKALAARRRQAMNMRSGGFLGIELKFKDYFINDQVPGGSSAGGVTQKVWDVDNVMDTRNLSNVLSPIGGISQGDGPSDRDGRVAVIKSLFIAGCLTLQRDAVQNATADDIGGVWIALVLDTQTNGAELNPNEVYTNPLASSTLGTEYAADGLICPLRNLERTKRFKILGTRYVPFDPPPMVKADSLITTYQQSGQKKKFQIGHSFGKGLKINYSGTTDAISSVVDNSLHVIAAHNMGGLSEDILCHANVRVRFCG